MIIRHPIPDRPIQFARGTIPRVDDIAHHTESTFEQLIEMSDDTDQEPLKPSNRPSANIRPAKREEFDVLSRILCNAFIPLWCVAMCY